MMMDHEDGYLDTVAHKPGAVSKTDRPLLGLDRRRDLRREVDAFAHYITHTKPRT